MQGTLRRWTLGGGVRPNRWADLDRAVREDRVRAADLAPGHGSIVVDRPHAHRAARGVDLLHELRVRGAPVRRIHVSAGLAHNPGGIDRSGAFEDAELELRLHLPELADRRVMERNHRAFRDRAELAQHRDQLLLEAWILDGHLLDLDDQPDLADCELDYFLKQWNVLALAGVEAAQLGGSVIAHEARAVGGPLERVVVDDHEPAVRGEVHVAFDQVAARRDRGPERPHGVFRMLRGVATMPAQQGSAVIVSGLITCPD